MNYEALSREKWEVREGDLLEIFPPSDQARTWRYIYMHVYTLLLLLLQYCECRVG